MRERKRESQAKFIAITFIVLYKCVKNQERAKEEEEEEEANRLYQIHTHTHALIRHTQYVQREKETHPCCMQASKQTLQKGAKLNE